MKKPYKIKHDKPKVKLLLYGGPGRGKTFFAAEAQGNPDLADVLFVNIEGGLLTVSDRDVTAIDIGKNDDGSSNHNIIGDLEKVVWALATKQPGYDTVKTVVVDSVSELQTRDLEDLVKNAGKHDIDVREQRDYGIDTNRLKRVLRQLKDLNLNVIFTAIYKEITNDSGKVIEICPALTDKVKEALMAYVDFVWYLYTEGEGKDQKRILLTEQKGLFRAKTRNKAFYELIGQKIENPKFSELYAKLCKVTNES